MWMDIAIIIAINAGATGFGEAMRRLAGGAGRRAFLGYYLVLLPLLMRAWQQPECWFDVGFAVVGLVVITVSFRRAHVAAARAGSLSARG